MANTENGRVTAILKSKNPKLRNAVPPVTNPSPTHSFTWFEVHNAVDVKEVIDAYGGQPAPINFSCPDMMCIESGYPFGTPGNKIINVYFRHDLENGVYDFWVKKMGYGDDDFRRLISDRQFR